MGLPKKLTEMQMKFAHELISKTNPSEGTVIRADEQYAGRGQFGSSWSAKPGENIKISDMLRM